MNQDLSLLDCFGMLMFSVNQLLISVVECGMKINTRGWRDDSSIKHCYSRRLGFNSKHPNGSSQPSETLFRGNPVLSCCFCKNHCTYACYTHAYMKAKHPYTLKTKTTGREERARNSLTRVAGQQMGLPSCLHLRACQPHCLHLHVYVWRFSGETHSTHL